MQEVVWLTSIKTCRKPIGDFLGIPARGVTVNIRFGLTLRVPYAPFFVV
jgi:hypothetical protein